jgi:hypothetical protein
LNPKDTDKYEYEISIEANGTINVTQLTGYWDANYHKN